MRHAVVGFLRRSQEKIIRTLVVKARPQASEFETNHRYIADAIVSESVTDTASGVDSNETRYSIDYQIGLGALYVKKCVMPRPVSQIASQQFLHTSVY